MFRRILIALLVVALMPASLSAAARPIAAAQTLPVERSAVLSAPGESGAAMTVAAQKRCQRGPSGFSSCGPDIGLPVAPCANDGPACPPVFDDAGCPLAGLTPPCLVGPPRFG
ncbi:hypothetical protein ABGN05_04060 [Aquibium sp. LZ166]|uniref:Uncharacterized protein n=1 Tax=Aquibium pacificus TaxID=3153579 RepID=A0ABV3SDL5_9HYPH